MSSRIASTSSLAAAVAIAVTACTYQVPAAGSDGLTLIQITPAGEFRPADGRELDVPAWRIDANSAQVVIARHAARKQPVVIDYEHQTLNKEKNGQPAPAAGWFRELRWIEGEGLFALVAFTPKARAAIDAQEYLYFSPVFEYSQADGTVLDIRMGALTNDPGIHGMQPMSLLAAATAAFLSPTTDQEQSVNPLLAAVLAHLGLSATTTEETATAALTAAGPLKPLQDRAVAACTALNLPADASADSVTAACTSLRSTAPDPAKFVPVSALQDVQTQLAALTAQQVDRQVDDLVKPALADGRLLPAMETWARDLGKSNFAALTGFLKTAQPIAALTATQPQGKEPVLAKGDAQLSAEELAVCTAMGMSPEQYKAGAATAVANA